jgi:hypothetical protein
MIYWIPQAHENYIELLTENGDMLLSDEELILEY